MKKTWFLFIVSIANELAQKTIPIFSTEDDIAIDCQLLLTEEFEDNKIIELTEEGEARERPDLIKKIYA